MRELKDFELDRVSGGQIPDEDLQDMRDNNPDAENWSDVENNPPPPRLVFESAFWEQFDTNPD